MSALDQREAFAKPVTVVVREQNVDPDYGLDAHDVLRRRAQFGQNQLRVNEKKSALIIFAHQFKGVIVWLLVFAAAVSIFYRDIAEGLAIVVVLAINTTIGFFTELRAARSMEALARMSEFTTRVRRGGKVISVDAQELVPGDIVLLEAGDMVTADLRLIQISNLDSDESVLTGESAPVAKQVAPVSPNSILGDRSSMAFKGTAITQGTGEGVVTATGMATELGRINHLVQAAQSATSPLEMGLDHLGHRLIRLTLVLAVLVIGAGILRGHEIAEMIQTGVALAVAAVPEGLPVVATLCLARGMWRMAEHNAVISNLSSVETLGATTVILTDKTGTLTENRMAVVRYLTAGADINVAWRDERVQFEAGAGERDPQTDPQLSAVLRIGALCNGATLENGTQKQLGDPMEVALLRVDRHAGRSQDTLLETHKEVREYAFEQKTKMMATVRQDGDREGNGFFYAIKGAPEAVLDVCKNVLGNDGEQALDATMRAQWQDRSRAAASEGLRLLALAFKRADRADAAPYEDLTLAGIVCLRDPLRADVGEAIVAAQAAGVRVVMLTGDHADTAAAIAREAGLGLQGKLTVMEGRDLEEFETEENDASLRHRILSADVFARVAPETKLKLTALYQRNGHIVAMTGDGVNDAPALKQADIGIAMGQRGTEVAREAADMVLKDDSVGTIIAAMRQGRVIFDNIRKFVVYLMSCNVSEVLIVGLAVGAGLPMPLLPLQILFLNLVTDVFPAFALGFGSGDEHIMRQPPRNPTEQILDRGRWLLIGVLGGAITMIVLTAFWLALHWLMLPIEKAVTVAFLTLALAQLWNVFNVRMPGGGFLVNEVTRNVWVWGAIGLCLVMIAIVFWLPALSIILKLPNPGLSGFLLAFGSSLGPLVIGQMFLHFGPKCWLGSATCVAGSSRISPPRKDLS